MTILRGAVFALPMLLAAAGPSGDALLQQRANDVHSLIWANFIQPEHYLLLTRLGMNGKPLYFPGQRESPSLEDTSLYGGLYLDAMVQHAEMSSRPTAVYCARAMFEGLIKNATVSPSKGLLARGTHPDGVTYWGEPSVDQYTGAIFGLWRYFRSSVATPQEKRRIGDVIGAMLARFEKDHWTIVNEDGRPTRFGDIGSLQPTRAERLLGVLLVGHEVSGDGRWLAAYESLKKDRLRLAANFDQKAGAPWIQIQNAMAIRMLLDLAKNPDDLAVFREGARTLAATCAPALASYQRMRKPDGTLMRRSELQAAGLWDERSIRQVIQGSWDAIISVLLMEQADHYPAALAALREMLTGIDFGEHRYVEDIFPGEYNYWLAARKGLVKYDATADLESRPQNEYWKSEGYRLMQDDVYGKQGGVFSLH